MKLLKVLAILGRGDASASASMYAVLGEVLQRSDPATTIGNALLYQAASTIAAIVPDAKLLQACSDLTQRFLRSDSHNLKYCGIEALGRLVALNPDCGAEHQLAVIECLEDPDPTLKRCTLNLLYAMTRASNVEVIVERMLAFLQTTEEEFGKREVAQRICTLAERYAPSTHWFIATMTSVFQLAGSLLPPRTAHEVMRLIAEGSGEEEEADRLLRSQAVRIATSLSLSRLPSSCQTSLSHSHPLLGCQVASYMALLDDPGLPPMLLHLICWVVGEYGAADGGSSADAVIARLCDAAESNSDSNDVRVRVVHATLLCSPSCAHLIPCSLPFLPFSDRPLP